MNVDPDDPLHNALRAWQVTTPLPPRFKETVWQRIARSESKGNLGRWQTFVTWITAFNHPTLAISYTAILLLLGLTAGYGQANEKVAQMEARARRLYVQSVDPFQMKLQSKQVLMGQFSSQLAIRGISREFGKRTHVSK